MDAIRANLIARMLAYNSYDRLHILATHRELERALETTKGVNWFAPVIPNMLATHGFCYHCKIFIPNAGSGLQMVCASCVEEFNKLTPTKVSSYLNSYHDYNNLLLSCSPGVGAAVWQLLEKYYSPL